MTVPDVRHATSVLPLHYQRPLRSRLWRLVVDHWVIHLTLITLAGLFVLPFLWMIGMSLKTDDEATNTALFPSVPTFCGVSPYVVEPAAIERPAGVSAARWNGILPQLTQVVEASMSKLPLPLGTPSDSGEKLYRAAETEAITRGLSRLDARLWTRADGDGTVVAAFRDGVTNAELSALLADRLSRLELSGVQIRSLTGHVVQVGEPGQAGEWKVLAGDADLVPIGGNGLMLRYRFANPSSAPVVVRYDFDATVTPEELHRLIVSYVGDASWNRINAEVQLGEQRYVSEQSTYVAESRGASIIFQPPTFQDQTLEPRNWVALRPTERAAGLGPTRASVTLTLSPSSTVRAVYGKLERNYARAFKSVPFWTYLLNSVELVVLQLGGALFSSAFVGYAFARLNWPGRSVAMGILLATMMLPGQVTMIPSFLIWRSLGWYNTLTPLWIVAWLGNSFFIFLMVQHMRTIPRELDEAAKIDGMSALQTWWYVIVPQVKPTLAAIAIMTFMGAWNDFMGPLIMLRDQAKFPLSLGLFSMRLDSGDDWSLIMAGNLLMTLPVVLIFFLFQRYFIEGVTVTGMKG